MTAIAISIIIHCAAVARVWVPELRGSIVTIGCTDRELGA